MPDWLTYVLSAWVMCEIATILGLGRARRYVGVAAVGSVIPDLVKPFYLLKGFAGIDLIAFSVPFATPVGSILVVGLVSLYFARREARNAFAFLLGGTIIHLVWDILLHPYGGGTLVFFPFSMEQYAFGLIWSDSILPLTVAAVPAGLLLIRRAVVARGSGRRTSGGL
jgi:hypothetical protein